MTVRASIAFTLCWFCARAVAAVTITGVSGTLSEGQTVTVTGSGFGAVGPVVRVFDDFEGGAAGAAIATGPGSARVGGWTGLSPGATYSGDFRRSGAQSMKADFAFGTAQVELAYPDTADVFLSYSQFLPVGKDVPGTNNPDSPNWKYWWIGDDSGWPFGSDYVVVNLSNEMPGGNLIFLMADDTAAPARHSPGYFSTAQTRGQWIGLQTYMQNSTTAGITTYEELTNSGVQTLFNDTGVVTAHDGELWNILTIPGFARYDPNSVAYLDDIYFATGPGARARVEIGDRATRAACTRLAVFPPTSWSNGVISATVRRGGLPDGPAYLYVIDASGAVNAAGFPVYLGGPPDATPPAPPRGLGVR